MSEDYSSAVHFFSENTTLVFFSIYLFALISFDIYSYNYLLVVSKDLQYYIPVNRFIDLFYQSIFLNWLNVFLIYFVAFTPRINYFNLNLTVKGKTVLICVFFYCVKSYLTMTCIEKEYTEFIYVNYTAFYNAMMISLIPFYVIILFVITLMTYIIGTATANCIMQMEFYLTKSNTNTNTNNSSSPQIL